MKLLGSIFEEMYGPLPVSDTVHPTCAVLELASTDAGNSVEQTSSSSQRCQLTTVSVTHNSSGTLQPPAEVDVSDVQLSVLGVVDCDAQSKAGSPSIQTKHSELVSDVSHQPPDIARDWSTGMLVTDCSGKAVEVLMMLFLTVASPVFC